jgi:Leucine-rich repeat (LRR) protein
LGLLCCRGNLRLLDLSHNQLSGALPEMLGDASYLEVLRLSSNDLTGTIPASYSVLDHLQYLGLQENNLTKGSALPPWMLLDS